MKDVIVLPAIFTKMTPRKDKSWKLEIETRELAGEEVRIMADRLGTEGYWANSQNSEPVLDDIPEGDADSGLDSISPSKRLRNVLYVLWEQHGKPEKSFELWYASKMERIINVVKEELE